MPASVNMHAAHWAWSSCCLKYASSIPAVAPQWAPILPESLETQEETTLHFGTKLSRYQISYPHIQPRYLDISPDDLFGFVYPWSSRMSSLRIGGNSVARVQTSSIIPAVEIRTASFACLDAHLHGCVKEEKQCSQTWKNKPWPKSLQARLDCLRVCSSQCEKEQPDTVTYTLGSGRPPPGGDAYYVGQFPLPAPHSLR